MLAQSEKRTGVGCSFTGDWPLAGFGLWVGIGLLRFLLLTFSMLLLKSGDYRNKSVARMWRTFRLAKPPWGARIRPKSSTYETAFPSKYFPIVTGFLAQITTLCTWCKGGELLCIFAPKFAINRNFVSGNTQREGPYHCHRSDTKRVASLKQPNQTGRE